MRMPFPRSVLLLPLAALLGGCGPAFRAGLPQTGVQPAATAAAQPAAAGALSSPVRSSAQKAPAAAATS
jgi:hypothetical protein